MKKATPTATMTNHDAIDRLSDELLTAGRDVIGARFEPDGNTPTPIRPLSSAERAAVERFLARLRGDLAPLLDQRGPLTPELPRPHLRLV